jgi:hypothetical protein
MNSRPLAAFLGAVGVVPAVAALAVAGVGPFAAADPAAGPGDPALESLSSTGGEYVESVWVGGWSAVAKSGGAYRVVFNGNVSVPDANWTIGNASVERRGPGEYVLAFERQENPEKAGRGCTSQAHYEAVVHMPADDEQFVLAVEVDRERVRTVRHGVAGSGVGSNASGGDEGGVESDG